MAKKKQNAKGKDGASDMGNTGAKSPKDMPGKEHNRNAYDVSAGNKQCGKLKGKLKAGGGKFNKGKRSC